MNLCASTTPAALNPPAGAEFEGCEFFVTRRREEGRDRYRLHLGHFASLAEARDKAEDLRATFPTAWAGPAPQDCATPEPPATGDTLSGLSNVREVLAALAAGPGDPPADVLTPAQEWALLETGHLPGPRFALQLVSSGRPIDLSTLPQPAPFDVYTLYNVEGSRESGRWYGLRLGFFNDVEAAKRVACYLKRDYPTVVVVPVTPQERECANGESAADTGTPAASQPPAPVADEADPFRLEPALLPARIEPPVAEGPAKPAPFELLPVAPPPEARDAPALPEAQAQAPAPAAAVNKTPAAPRSAEATKRPAGKRVMSPRRPAPPGHQSPDTATFEVLGASTITVSDEPRLRSKPTLPASVGSGGVLPPARNRLGIGKWFGRRSA